MGKAGGPSRPNFVSFCPLLLPTLPSVHSLPSAVWYPSSVVYHYSIAEFRMSSSAVCSIKESHIFNATWLSASGLCPLHSTAQCRGKSQNYTVVLISPQCISSIGQIMKSVCVSVSERVSHAKRAERSTDCNLPPILTKLATTVESQEMWLPTVFGGNTKYFYPPNRKWN